MTIPSIKSFNSWELKYQIDFIEYETRGVRPSPGMPGFLVYPVQDMIIKYITDKKCRIIGAKAMTYAEGVESMNQVNMGVMAAVNTN